MTDVPALVADLQARGVTLESRGDKLAVRPASRLTLEEREALRRHKAEVLALLAEPPELAAAPALAPAETPHGAALVEAACRLFDGEVVSREPVRPAYSHPWPDGLPGLGRRQVVAFDLCATCGAGTWVMYADVYTCLACARQKAGGRPPVLGG